MRYRADIVETSNAAGGLKVDVRERLSKFGIDGDTYFAIIIDLMMPGMNGIETTIKIREYVEQIGRASCRERV